MPRATRRSPHARRRVLALALLVAARAAAAQNATVCPTNQLDWYTSVVGESPCRTYERLRQICDPRYAVGQFSTTTPGDTCDSQLHLCCCNSIAWNLSMLCMNCQHAGNVTADTVGIDASNAGTYGAYLASCGVPSNGSLATNIQADVCTAQIDIRPTLYEVDWMDTGEWFYTFFRETMTTALGSETGKNLTNCPNIASSSSSPSIGSPTHTPTTPADSTTPTASAPPTGPSPNTLDVGAIAGGVAGGVVALLLALVAAALWWRRRVRRQHFGDAIEPGDFGRDELPVLEPFLDGEAPPPAYGEDPRKGARPPPPTRYPPSSSAYGPSHAGSGAGSGSGSGSAWGGSSAYALSAATAAGSQAGGAGTDSRRVREKGSGWRLSEKGPPPDAP